MDAAGPCTAGVSVSTLAKCVKDGGNRSRVGSGSGGGGGADGADVCFMFLFFFFLFPLLFLCSFAQEKQGWEKKRGCWEFTRVDEHKLMSDLS